MLIEKNEHVIQIAICDDDPWITGQLEQLIINAVSNLSRVDISIFYSGTSFSRAIQPGCPFDIIFMDIEMKGIDGIQAGHLLRENEDNDFVQLIYISSYEQYHVQLFDVQPSGFVKKPIEPEVFAHKLISAVQKVIRKRQHGMKKFLPIQQSGKELLVPFRDIMYIESNLRKIHLYTRNEQIDYYSTLNTEEKKLPASHFIRIHQSYMVNCYFIREISSHKVVLLTGQELPISDKKSASAKQNYLKFRGSLIG